MSDTMFDTCRCGCVIVSDATAVAALKAEVERLRAGGCARDQGTTQYCAEAAAMADEITRLRAEIAQLEQWNGEIAFNARIFADALKEIQRIVPKHIAGEIAFAALEGAND